ncbi:uncharacterized protein LOC135396875 [Ornithodoros turicata]|uniref:uncharacterized protein LOC135396875 n=1 Tax=Ornithodoros turicata TaxID=34597 RepID=UPI003139A5DF
MACASVDSSEGWYTPERATQLRDVLCALKYPDVPSSEYELWELFFYGRCTRRNELLKWTCALIEPLMADKLRSSPNDEEFYRLLEDFLNSSGYYDEQTNSSFVNGTATVQEQVSVWQDLLNAASYYCLGKSVSLQLLDSPSEGVPDDSSKLNFEHAAKSKVDPASMSTSYQAQSVESLDEAPPFPASPSRAGMQQYLDYLCKKAKSMEDFLEGVQPLKFPSSTTVKELCGKIDDVCESLGELNICLEAVAPKMSSVQAAQEHRKTDYLISEAALRSKEAMDFITRIQHCGDIIEKLTQSANPSATPQ